MVSLHPSDSPVSTPETSPPDPTLSVDFFLRETQRARRYRDIEKPLLLDVQTNFFLFAALFNMERHNSAWFHLREAITMLQMLRLHEEETYLGIEDEILSLFSRRVFWLLFITERYDKAFRKCMANVTADTNTEPTRYSDTVPLLYNGPSPCPQSTTTPIPILAYCLVSLTLSLSSKTLTTLLSASGMFRAKTPNSLSPLKKRLCQPTSWKLYRSFSPSLFQMFQSARRSSKLICWFQDSGSRQWCGSSAWRKDY
jgi:hypothetical protein